MCKNTCNTALALIDSRIKAEAVSNALTEIEIILANNRTWLGGLTSAGVSQLLETIKNAKNL